MTRFGNRTLLLNGGAATTFTYNGADELATTQSSAGVTSFAYDGNGNLLTTHAPGNQWTTNSWDGENRLTRVALPSGIVDSFTYNGDGQRVQKRDSTGTTNHVWDGQNIILETNASNIIQVVYTLEPLLYGNLVSQSRGGVDSFYLFDALGSTRQLASGMGSLADSYLYDSFGGVLLANGSTTNPFRFVGKSGYYDDPDLSVYYVRARYYDAPSGLFVSRDPISVLPSRIKQGLLQAHGLPAIARFYDYGFNNPANLIDPSGLISGQGKYKNCCGITELHAFVYTVHMYGGSWNDQGDIAFANNVYQQCCIKIHSVGRASISKAQTVRVLGWPPYLDEYPNDGPLTNEEKQMGGLINYEDNYIYAYYVYGLTHSYGEAFPPDVFGTQRPSPGLAVASNTVAQTVAHELGHVLGIFGHNFPAGNLMSVEGDNKDTTLTEPQCDKIRTSKLLSTQGPPTD